MGHEPKPNSSRTWLIGTIAVAVITTLGVIIASYNNAGIANRELAVQQTATAIAAIAARREFALQSTETKIVEALTLQATTPDSNTTTSQEPATEIENSLSPAPPLVATETTAPTQTLLPTSADTATTSPTHTSTLTSTLRPTSTFTPTPQPTSTPAPTKTPAPTQTLPPTPGGRGTVIGGPDFQVSLVDYDYRSVSDETSEGVVEVSLLFINNTDQEVPVLINFLEVEGIDNIGTRYGERNSVATRTCEDSTFGCLGLPGAVDPDRLDDYQISVPSNSTYSFTFELQPEGFYEDDIVRVDLRTDWIDVDIPIQYRLSQPNQLLATWRLVR